MTFIPHWTTNAVESMPQVEGERYEIIDGELYVTTQPHARHQATIHKMSFCLELWNVQNNLGVVIPTPGIIFSPVEAVAPDLVWVSKGRLNSILGPEGKLNAAPELVVEVLSPGKANEERDREVKLKLYSRQGVPEYWIADWRAGTVEVYRRTGDTLALAETLTGGAELTSPLLPGFACSIERFFEL